MIKCLKLHAESIQADLDMPVADLPAINQLEKEFIDAICKAIATVKGVSETVYDTEWDNTTSYIIRIGLDGNVSGSRDLCLAFKISRMAPVAYSYWLSQEPWLIAGKEIKAGVTVDGRHVETNAKDVQNQAVTIFRKSGVFIFSKADFEFKVKTRSCNVKPAKFISGLAFYFG